MFILHRTHLTLTLAVVHADIIRQELEGLPRRFDEFKREIILKAQHRVATGEISAEIAFKLLRVTQALERIADHCTNICEQVIYLESGLIVRHLPEGWTKPAPPQM